MPAVQLRPFHYACICGSIAIAVVAVIIAVIVFSPRSIPTNTMCAKKSALSANSVIESLDRVAQVGPQTVVQEHPEGTRMLDSEVTQNVPTESSPSFVTRTVAPAQRQRKAGTGKKKMGVRLHAMKKRSPHVKKPSAPSQSANQVGAPALSAKNVSHGNIRYSSSVQIIPRTAPTVAASVMSQTQLATGNNYKSFRGRSASARADMASKVSKLHLNRALKRPGYVNGKGVGLPKTMRRVPVELR